MTKQGLLDYTMSKQDILDYISEKYGNDKRANKLKRIVFKTYSGKYIYYADKRYSFDELNKLYEIL